MAWTKNAGLALLVTIINSYLQVDRIKNIFLQNDFSCLPSRSLLKITKTFNCGHDFTLFSTRAMRTKKAFATSLFESFSLYRSFAVMMVLKHLELETEFISGF